MSDQKLKTGYPRAELGQFPIKPYKRNIPILRRLDLNGAEAEHVAAAWRQLDFGWQYQALCHGPVYGLRFYSGRKLLLETSICWECQNFYVQERWHGFNAKAQSGKDFLKLLDSLVPYERPANNELSK